MEIVIIRHGKTSIETTGKVSSAGFGTWTYEYDVAGIDNESKPQNKAIKRAKECNFTVCSDLARSIESAKLLELNDPDLICSSFRECGMPHGNWQHPKLSKTTWSILFRLMQFAGYSPNAESYNLIKERSKQCASHLIELAKVHDSVLFVGHGSLNWLIHKYLITIGWVGPAKSSRKHWEYCEYICK